MSFYGNMDEKISKIKNDALQKTKDVSEIVRISSALKAEEEKRERLYREIGQASVEDKDLADDGKMQKLREELSECQDKIQDFETKLEALRGIIKCPECGKSVSSSQSFCSNCGAKLMREEYGRKHSNEAASSQPLRFCPTCGKENRNSAKYCVQCGFDLMQEDKAAAVHAGTFSGSLGLREAPTVKIMFLAAAVLQIMLAVLWFVNIFEIEGLGFISQACSMHSSFEGYDMLSYFTVILCLAAAGLSVYSFVQFDKSKRYKMLFQIVITAWCLAMFLLIVFTALGTVSSGGYDGLVVMKMRFGGWVYLIDSTALLVILIKARMKTKKQRK